MPTRTCILAATDFSGTSREALHVARDEAGLPRGLTPTMVAMGDPAQEIVAAAAALGAAMIVMGTHGHGLAARLVMGSVADKVLRHADRPVLIVPHPSLKHLDPSAETETQGAEP